MREVEGLKGGFCVMADGGGADQDDVALAGGIANSGAVVRVGETVRRRATRYSPLVRAVVTHLEAVGFAHVDNQLDPPRAGRERDPSRAWRQASSCAHPARPFRAGGR